MLGVWQLLSKWNKIVLKGVARIRYVRRHGAIHWHSSWPAKGMNIEMRLFVQSLVLLASTLFSIGSFAGFDGDGVPDDADNCVSIANADQLDVDSDGVGNECDADADGDGINYLGFSIRNGNPLIGDWRLAGQGSLKVGPEPLDGSWFSISASDVQVRACQFDDVFRFNADGSFANVNGDETWLEIWQGVDVEACGTPVEPHDGRGAATYAYDSATGTLRLDGVGAYLGLPRIVNEGGLPGVAVPNSVTYKVETLPASGHALTVTIEEGSGTFWTFSFVRANQERTLSGAWKLADERFGYDAPEPPGVPLGGSPFFFTSPPYAELTAARACLFDDVFFFDADGTFANVQGDSTWIETWQGVDADACGAPVAPHDGSAEATYVYDADGDAVVGTLTISGTGAHVGIPRAVNTGALPNGAAIPDSLVYTVQTLASDKAGVMILQMRVYIESGGDVFFTDLVQVSDNCPLLKNFGQLDSDGDGEGNACDTDDDGDGVSDASDAFPLDATETLDTDSDGTGNNADTDDDGDGVADISDAFPLDSSESVDTDSDGIGNNADTDDDADGVLDTADAFALISLGSLTDTDDDGRPNDCDNDCQTLGMTADTDDDNDEVADVSDAFPLDANESIDTDADGTGNNADTDDDGDGVADISDAFPLDSSESVDTDSDGIGNNADTDDDADGVLDTADAFALISLGSLTDTDDDGRPNDCDNDCQTLGMTADTDDDNDEVADVSDAFPLDANESIDTDADGTGNNADTDDDGDGVSDGSDVFPLDATETLDTDSDGTGNNADTDDDNDGVADIDDLFPLDVTESRDSDGDGVGDNSDAFPNDVKESFDSDTDGVGDNSDNCINVKNSDQTNTDGDLFGDECDLDDDNDGFTDAREAQDGTNPLSRFSCRSGCFSFDVDENLEAQPLTDGLLVIRHLFGFSGESLTSGAVDTSAERGTSELISGYLMDAESELDIDGDGASEPLTDGLLLIRYLFGFSGDSLISGAIGSGAERDTAEEVEAYIKERVPVQ